MCKEVEDPAGEVDAYLEMTAGAHLVGRIRLPAAWPPVYRRIRCPFKRLSLAVLFQALRDYMTPEAGWMRHRERVHWREDWDSANEWLMSDDADEPFGFVRVCERLGLSHRTVRRKLLAGEISLYTINRILNCGKECRPPKSNG